MFDVPEGVSGGVVAGRGLARGSPESGVWTFLLLNDGGGDEGHNQPNQTKPSTEDQGRGWA